MCLAQGPQRSGAGEARTRGPSVSRKKNGMLYSANVLKMINTRLTISMILYN